MVAAEDGTSITRARLELRPAMSWPIILNQLVNAVGDEGHPPCIHEPCQQLAKAKRQTFERELKLGPLPAEWLRKCTRATSLTENQSPNASEIEGDHA